MRLFDLLYALIFALALMIGYGVVDFMGRTVSNIGERVEKMHGD